ncbi:MAG: hypothetical protein J5933_03485 [Clostridia bacterium]|nr:hypothetical protein [Clostridia bacterium]
MIKEEVKKLLEKHYGTPRKTLTIGKSTNRGKSIYYYTFPDSEKVTAIRDVLNGTQLFQGDDGDFSELTQMFASSPADKNNLSQCARYKECGGDWFVDYYEITGVRYHRSSEKQIDATLLLGKYPVTSLSSSDGYSFFGFWGQPLWRRVNGRYQTTRGFSYWINRNMIRSIAFRNFAADFFFFMGCQNKIHILKDISRTIRKYGYFLPSVTFEEITRYHTPKEYISAIMPGADSLGVNLNRIDLNLAYVISILTPAVYKKDWQYLRSLSPAVVSAAFSWNMLFDGIKIHDLVSGYYLCKLENERINQYTVSHIAQNYCQMCIDNNIPIRLVYSYHGLVGTHNTLYNTLSAWGEMDVNTPLVADPSRFDFLEERLNTLFPGEFERIRDAGRLLEEGNKQHNCVYSRRNVVREDRAAFFHWDYAGEHCTIQFAVDLNGKYCVEEIKAKYNAECSLPVLQQLRDALNKVNEN